MEAVKKYKHYLAQPCTTKYVALFRIIFGTLMAYYCWKYRSDTLVYTYFIRPDFIFSYPMMDWFHLGVLPMKQMFLLYKIMLGSAVCIALGLFYRSALLIFCLTFTYGFLLDKTHYNNHYYLISLISFLMIFVPANGRWSLDAYFRFSPRRDNMQNWQLVLLQAQICCVYFFGGLTKLDPDWMNTSVVRFTFIDYPQWAIYVITYVGAITDLALPFLLLIPAYKRIGIIWAALFLVSVKLLIDVGVFPYMMLGTLLLFLPENEQRDAKSVPLSKAAFGWMHAYLIFQLLIPFHHLLYPGHVSWTKEGDRFAWRMFSQENTGHLDVFVTDADTGKTIKVPRLKGLTVPGYDEMTTYPKMIWSYAQYLEKVYKAEGIQDPIITVDSFVALNGRNFARFIDPEVDLTKVPYPFYHHAPWILPHPDKQETTSVSWYNVGAFFEPAYQLAVIDAKILIPGDSSDYQWYQQQMQIFEEKYKMDAQAIADRLVEARTHMWEKGGPLLSIRTIMEFSEGNSAVTLDQLLRRVKRAYVLEI